MTKLTKAWVLTAEYPHEPGTVLAVLLECPEWFTQQAADDIFRYPQNMTPERGKASVIQHKHTRELAKQFTRVDDYPVYLLTEVPCQTGKEDD